MPVARKVWQPIAVSIPASESTAANHATYLCVTLPPPRLSRNSSALGQHHQIPPDQDERDGVVAFHADLCSFAASKSEGPNPFEPGPLGLLDVTGPDRRLNWPSGHDDLRRLPADQAAVDSRRKDETGRQIGTAHGGRSPCNLGQNRAKSKPGELTPVDVR